MSLESFIESVRNRKTQKMFILVDDTLEMRYKVINPAGEVLVLPDALFDEDPVMIPAEKFAAEFTPEQLSALARFNEQVASQARAEARIAPPKIEASPAKRETRSSTPRKAREPSGPVRRGLAATWVAPRLTFYRHKIDPLHAKQSFKISIEGSGDFEITKEEFLAQFNDVVMSPSYRADGLYSYPAIPDKARRYFKS